MAWNAMGADGTVQGGGDRNRARVATDLEMAIAALRALVGDGVPPGADDVQVVKAAAGTIRFQRQVLDTFDKLLGSVQRQEAEAGQSERADGEPLPLAVGRVPSYCGRVERPHAGHVWATQPGHWCPGDEVPR